MEQRYGQEEYAEYLKAFFDGSNEKEKLSEAVIAACDPQPTDSFLDVGAGSGDITHRIAPLVGETTVIEPNERFAQGLRESFDSVLQAGFGEVTLERTYDLVLASHVFYYFEPGSWEQYLRKMYDVLAPQGKLAIILFDDTGDWYDFYSQFYPPEKQDFYVPPAEFAKLLSENHIPFEEHPIQTTFDMPLDDILKVFLYLSRTTQEEQLQEFLKEKTQNGRTMIHADHRLFVASK